MLKGGRLHRQYGFPQEHKARAQTLAYETEGSLSQGYDHKPMEQIKSLTYSLTMEDLMVLSLRD